MPLKIQDEFTDLPISGQRKWQLRNPEKHKAIQRNAQKKYRSSPKYKAAHRKWQLEHLDYHAAYERNRRKRARHDVLVSRNADRARSVVSGTGSISRAR